MLSSNPTSHFLTLKNRPVVAHSGETKSDSLKLHYWEWTGHQPTVLFCHAASFHGRCYDRIINNALRGYHVIALDFRGHGRSQQHPPPYRFPWFGEDVLQFIETLNLSSKNLIGIGHSVGGYALTYAAVIAQKRLFHSLLLIDPVIIPRSIYEHENIDKSTTDYIFRRKNQWSSVEDMISRLEKRGTFSKWPKDVLRNYCIYALDDNCKLNCSPEGEASIYQSGIHPDTNIYPLIEQSKHIHDIPIQIARILPGESVLALDQSPTAPDLVKYFRKGKDLLLESSKHLFPMEQPNIAIKLVKDFIRENQ
ncbi:unnamed protein product [Adineta ricciae]|uniref:AB hydrolase-1 domain-containing protein n=1 Tax=Adineta ricciae TaxID=249248 RepID=A0A815P597_ADIRI|nr:unnamed protein product [Adineta ricciae]CAF1444323.1 unnamed protein product [Adineta ricciae]